MSRHTVRAERDGRYWVILIDGEVRTQARREREIEMMARDWLSLMLDRDADSFELDIEIAMPEAARAHLERARVLREESERTRVEAARETAAAALVLHESGLTVREIGPLLHVSHQRAQQLVAAAR
ncbi:hypothetical protein [Curtobacterium sp. ISL-83]|uniref:hypothetical protein n=1 Tax=Curtobacterium sp. ISL-83 TaxID=2819145 RepID=UPI001BE697BE|nr:hypothetical protein [Curtobacterium sp. ISL-83]MBT2501435.1 hypothetical protein [Curtobacterium sp. ISL-83]